MKNIVLIFSLLLFCVSCKEEALQKMRRADSIMNSNCDSALVLLSQIDGAKLCSNSGRAYYALLLTEARYKNFIPLENDSLISIATEYYTEEFSSIRAYISEIKRMNGLTSDTLYADNYILIPYYCTE